jgi:hypothetical protein
MMAMLVKGSRYFTLHYGKAQRAGDPDRRQGV